MEIEILLGWGILNKFYLPTDFHIIVKLGNLEIEGFHFLIGLENLLLIDIMFNWYTK